MIRSTPPPGRGATANPGNRYAAELRQAFDDGWSATEPLPPLRTQVGVDASRAVLSFNQSPDVPFDRSVNPYRGCEHGCIYCYARPTHAYLGLSPGLDFETRLFHKPDAAAQLERELAAPGYRPATLVLGANTDPYQPIERRYRITRSVLQVLHDCRHPVAGGGADHAGEQSADQCQRPQRERPNPDRERHDARLGALAERDLSTKENKPKRHEPG